MIKFNPNSTLQTHIVRIHEAIIYIEQNLEKDLSLQQLARKSCYSPFHFHRIFSDLNRETPHEFVTRKRIEKIAWILLKDKSVPIQELVYKYGFDNPVSFSKAFKKYYGLSASELRKQAKSSFNRVVKQNSKIGKEEISVEAYFRNAEKIKSWMDSRAEVEARTLPKQRLVSIRSQGSFDLSFRAFNKLRSWSKVNGYAHEKPSQWLLVIHDNPAITEEVKLSHSACLRIEEDLKAEKEMTLLIIPGGNFLVGSFELEENEFHLAWGGMSIWLMEHGFTYRDGFYFEVFHTDSLFQQDRKHQVDICIPIE